LNLTSINRNQVAREKISDYVAHLQLHMILQARNLVPNLTEIRDSRNDLLHQTQAIIEKCASRQLV
jgi:hypothetical protein